VSGERFRSFSLGILRMRHPIFKIPGHEMHGGSENEGGSYDPFIGDALERHLIIREGPTAGLSS
jgi:hypothetical protein